MPVDETLVAGDPGHVEHHIALAQAINSQPVVGQELGYAERIDQDTTSSLPNDDTALMANVIAGLGVTVVGTGRPVEVEFWVGIAVHSVAGGVVYAHIMQDGVQVAMANNRIHTAGMGTMLIAKRRVVIPEGASRTFNVAKSIDTGGTGTYYAAANCPMYLSVVQR